MKNMGVTFYANNGKTLDMNFGAKQVLDRLTAFYWELLGIPQKVSKEDTLLIARILKNFIHLETVGDPIFFKAWKLPIETKEDLKYWKEVEIFFRESGGIKTRK
jgi:hypothetical protein